MTRVSVNLELTSVDRNIKAFYRCDPAQLTESLHPAPLEGATRNWDLKIAHLFQSSALSAIFLLFDVIEENRL